MKKYIKLYNAGYSVAEVAGKTGIPESTLAAKLRKAGVMRSQKEGLKIACKKGVVGQGKRGKDTAPRKPYTKRGA